jgi:hypothetical protein
MDGAADLELGLAEQLGVGLAGQQAGEVLGRGGAGALPQVEQALGFGLLFGGQGDVGHGGPPGGFGE